ncbi:unnamed protein product [Hymenolepis diminuta]|uniref:Uncharacterized protein n=1 Tax=Hymenolepis diminuta TaxID=6216 RepID=A0A564XWJ1_HYMDI|nr:unnamed protein product [Hymenolepis diminuta]
MERRTDFEMKATEPAEVVDVVVDDCRGGDCEESDGAADGGEFVTVAGVAGSDGSAVKYFTVLAVNGQDPNQNSTTDTSNTTTSTVATSPATSPAVTTSPSPASPSNPSQPNSLPASPTTSTTSAGSVMERRTDFDMKATEPAEVVDVVGDDCEEVGCEEVVGDVDADAVVEGVDFVGAGVTVVVLEVVGGSGSPKTTATNNKRTSERHI